VRGQDEFEAFVRSRGAQHLRTAHLLTGDLGHAEDLLQTALERLSRHWQRVDEPDAWLRRTLTRLAVDRWRRQARRVRAVSTTLDRSSTGDVHAPVDDRLDLFRALAALTAKQRAVLVLRYFDDLTEPDVAAALGCSVGNVKSTASRAIARLRADAASPAWKESS
jgi:RNA polymerase sigma-70 factor (sigma-E family)